MIHVILVRQVVFQVNATLHVSRAIIVRQCVILDSVLLARIVMGVKNVRYVNHV